MSGPEPRRGRPPLPADQKKPIEQKPTTRHVKLDADLDTALCLISLRHGIAINHLLKLAVRRFLAAGPEFPGVSKNSP